MRRSEALMVALIMIVGIFAIGNVFGEGMITGNAFRVQPHSSSFSEGSLFTTQVTTQFRGPMHVYVETIYGEDEPLRDIVLSAYIRTKKVADYHASVDADFFECEKSDEFNSYGVAKEGTYSCYAQFTFDYESRRTLTLNGGDLKVSSVDHLGRQGTERRVTLKDGSSQS